jgi:hypothetical protein
MPILVPTGRGAEVREVAPVHCAAGHPLIGGSVSVGWLGCLCVGEHRGHRTWACRTCGHVTYDPLHVDPAKAGGRERGR